MTAQRPVGWLCPWCDRDEQGAFHPERGAQAVDFSLPIELRICHWCANPTYDHPRPPTAHEIARFERIASLRGALTRFIREHWTRGGDRVRLSSAGRAAWKYAQFGAAVVGNALLYALEAQGLDRAEEIEQALQVAWSDDPKPST